jgi:hypothetical protein
MNELQTVSQLEASLRFKEKELTDLQAQMDRQLADHKREKKLLKEEIEMSKEANLRLQ